MVRIVTLALVGLSVLLLALWAGSTPIDAGVAAQATPPPALAEALEEANLREGPGVDYRPIGSIRAGAQYLVVGRHELYPWLLIAFGDPVQQGWVFADLVTISGELSQVPYLPSDVLIGGRAAPTPTPGAAELARVRAPTLTPSPTASPTLGVSPEAAQATLAPLTGVSARAINRANVRCGPGVDFLLAGTITSDESYPVLSRHATFPWLNILFPPTETAWVYVDLVEVEGDLNQVPVVNSRGGACPVLTPTPPVVLPIVMPWEAAPTGNSPVDMAALGEEMLDFLYERDYYPRTERLGAVFGLDLRTGEGFTLNPGIAFSGMSLIKVPVLLTYFRYLNGPPNAMQAEWIVGMMTCSNNPSSNAILAELGGGDPFAGAERVTDTMRELGLDNTFLQGPLVEDPSLSTIEGRVPIVTAADQRAANPDPFNQTTLDEMGWLLAALYECGNNERGPLLTDIDGITPVECRRILHSLDLNYLGAMIEAGVPRDVTVAHKHGWTTGDTHGDAAIVLSPGGDYVLVIALHQRGWLTYLDAWYNIAEMSRLVYNRFNPDAPLDAIHPEEVPETCDLEGHPLLPLLTRPDVPPLQ